MPLRNNIFLTLLVSKSFFFVLNGRKNIKNSVKNKIVKKQIAIFLFKDFIYYSFMVEINSNCLIKERSEYSLKSQA